MRGPRAQMLNRHQQDSGGGSPTRLLHHPTSSTKAPPYGPPPMVPHLNRILYSSSDTASLGNSGASVGPHSGDS